MNDKQKFKLKDGTEKSPDKKKEAKTAEQPVYKTEETLKQEARDRLAEQERIEAQKPPQSERGKKIDNYIYHYKWHTIIAVIGLFLIIFFVRDTVFRPKPDLTVVVATSRFMAQSENDALQSALERIAGDFNGDGKILVNLDSINLPIASMMDSVGETAEDDALYDFGTGNDPEMMQASMMKLMAVISAASDPLYLLDDDLYEYITAMSRPAEDESAGGAGAAADAASASSDVPDDYAIFQSIWDIPGASGTYGDRIAIKDTVLASEPGFEYLGDMAFSVRPPQNANQKNIDYQEFCVQILRTLSKG